MAANAPQLLHSTVSTTADVFHLTRAVKQVVFRNTSANSHTVRVFTGSTSAAAVAAATATVAVADANETFKVATTASRTVFKSTRPQFVALSVIATTGASTFDVEGTIWREGE